MRLVQVVVIQVASVCLCASGLGCTVLRVLPRVMGVFVGLEDHR